MPAEIFLKYRNERGAEQRIALTKSPFFIGRLPECDLPVNNTNLSRKHAKIERFADVAVISDCGSSNGTTLNGVTLSEPVALKNGDEIELGGDVRISVEIKSDVNFGSNYDDEDDYYARSSAVSGANSSSSAGSTNSRNSAPATASASSGSLLMNPFLIFPVVGVCAFALVGGMIFLLAPSANTKVVTHKDDDIETAPTVKRKTKDDDIPTKETPSPSATPIVAGSATPLSTLTSPTPTVDTPTPSNSSVPNELGKVEINAYKFLRRSTGDTHTALNSQQLGEINSRLKTLQNSAALRENLRTAKRNFAAIQTASDAQGLKPMMIAAIALAKIGEGRGDAANEANSLIPALKECVNILGVDTANDNLIVIAAFIEGNEPKQFQSKLGNLTTKYKLTATDVRNIWKLHERKEIKDETYDFILRFLAIGTIAQNPHDFNIDADAL